MPPTTVTSVHGSSGPTTCCPLPPLTLGWPHILSAPLPPTPGSRSKSQFWGTYFLPVPLCSAVPSLCVSLRNRSDGEPPVSAQHLPTSLQPGPSDSHCWRAARAVAVPPPAPPEPASLPDGTSHLHMHPHLRHETRVLEPGASSRAPLPSPLHSCPSPLQPDPFPEPSTLESPNYLLSCVEHTLPAAPQSPVTPVAQPARRRTRLFPAAQHPCSCSAALGLWAQHRSAPFECAPPALTSPERWAPHSAHSMPPLRVQERLTLYSSGERFPTLSPRDTLSAHPPSSLLTQATSRAVSLLPPSLPLPFLPYLDPGSRGGRVVGRTESR